MRAGLIGLAATAALAGCRTAEAPPPQQQGREVVAEPGSAVTVGGAVSVDVILTR